MEITTWPRFAHGLRFVTWRGATIACEFDRVSAPKLAARPWASDPRAEIAEVDLVERAHSGRRP